MENEGWGEKDISQLPHLNNFKIIIDSCEFLSIGEYLIV